jgi:hypothetical protein
MHYFGLKDIGSWIYNQRNRFIHQSKGFSYFLNQLRGAHKVLNQVKVSRDQPLSFLGTDITGMYLTQVLGSDGKEDHCVVITQKWIFDSNFSVALPRTQKSLDLCCSTDDIQSTFVSFPQIAHFPKVKATT